MNRITINQGDSLAAKLTTANTSYEMSGAIDLSGGTVTVPPCCTLQFEKGTKITNGTLVLNNTVFEGAKHSIRTIVSGTQYELDTDDFDLTGTNKAAIMQSIVNTATVIQLHGKLEDVFENITIENLTEFTENPNDYVESPKTFIGNGATIVNDFTSEVAALYIKTDDLIRITDINFEIAAGWAIKKDTIQRQTHTRLSFIIDRCRFKRTDDAYQSGLIRLINSREGNVTNCIFVSNGVYGGIGIDRSNAVNTNVIGCMFDNLKYGIIAIGQHVNGPVQNGGDGDDNYTSYACGLNVQSAVVLGCKYGIYIEGNDSFYLNNSMIDFCVYPLMIVSQDGANITNNYFSARRPLDVPKNNYPTYEHTAIISIINQPTKGASQANKRVILYGNTIYGHRNNACHGIDMDVESIDCTIQNNTFDFFKEYGIQLSHTNPTLSPTGDSNWVTEKLVIDNNRFHFVLANIDYNNGVEGSNAYSGLDAIFGNSFTGDEPVIISNNYVMNENNNSIQTKFISAGGTYFGDFLSFGNHDYLAETPTGTGGSEIKYAFRRNSTRIKINLSMTSSQSQLTINNPMNSANVVVYVANNKYPILVNSISVSNIVFRKDNNMAMSFVAIIERKYEL